VASFLTSEAPFVLFDFLKERIGLTWSQDLRMIGKVEDGVLVGVIGYNQYTGSSCQMHFAGDKKGWFSRKVLSEIFRYAFDVLNCKVVYAQVASSNAEALDIDRRVGFKDVVFLPDAHPDGGVYLLQMFKEDCRWLRRGKDDG